MRRKGHQNSTTMWTLRLYTVYLSLCLQLYLVTSHICLIFPWQRGPLDVSRAGSPTCSRHVPPCGGQKVEDPRVVFTTGQLVFIQWQQNLNHYEPGFAGYMDLAIATTPSSAEFTTLAVVSDTYVHAQDYQKNFTAVVRVPDIQCDHCVIRARYKSHKPGETPFLQCADIKIVSSTDHDSDREGKELIYTPKNHLDNLETEKVAKLRLAMQFRDSINMKFLNPNQESSQSLYGFGFSPFEPNKSNYVSVNTTSGKLSVVNTFDFGIDAMNMEWTKNPSRLPGKFMIDGVVSIDYPRGTSNILLHTTGSRDEPAAMLYIIGSTNGSLVQYSDIFQFTGGAINGMSWYTYGTSATFRIQPGDPGKDNWYFEAGFLDFGGSYEKRALIPSPESLYVNFQWIETDVNNYRRVYALLGNENEPDILSARIYTFDIYNGNYVGYVELDVSQYTFMSMYSYPDVSDLFAFSPGLWDEIGHAWSLVAINLKTGDVTKRCDVAPKGIFQRYYGGSIHQGQTNEIGLLYHVLRVEDSEADMVVGINPFTCAVTFSEVTNLRHVHSLQRVDVGT